MLQKQHWLEEGEQQAITATISEQRQWLVDSALHETDTPQKAPVQEALKVQRDDLPSTTDGDSQGVTSPRKVQEELSGPDEQRDEEEKPRRSWQDLGACFGLFCARLSCSWCVKMVILLICVGYLFLSGPLSGPTWIPISAGKACQRCDDMQGAPQPLGHKAPLRDLGACFDACNAVSDCQAVDWFNETKWCTLYAEACTKPTATWSGASSYQVAVACNLHNGTAGVLIAGRCTTAVELPTISAMAERQGENMLMSPRSWVCSLLVALLYTYLTSAWARQKMRPVTTVAFKPARVGWAWFRRGGIRRKVCVLVIFLALWADLTVWEFGRPPTSEKAVRTMPMTERGWFAVWALGAILLVCSPLRGCIVGLVATIGGWIMSAFLSMAALALSACFDVSALGLTGVLGGAADAAAAADAGVALEAGAAGDAYAAGEGAAMADGAAAGEAAAEATAAADAAAASELAIAADTAAAADMAAAALLCVVM